ncbi:MAG: sensor histidine kinase [Halobacteriales archaeon]
MTAGSEPGYVEDLYRLVADRDASMDERVDRAIEIGRDRLGVEHGVVTYTGDGNYEILESSMSSGSFTAGSVTDLETTWCRRVVADREPLAFGDARETAYAEDVALEETGLVCYIGVPLVVDGETFGTLCYSSESPQEDFTGAERRFVTLLAEWISREIERTKHHRELRAENERLDEFAGIVAHDLRNPLAGATGYLELVLEESEGRRAEFLRVVEESLDRMESLIDDLLLLAREGTDVGERTPVDLGAVATDAWDGVATGEASLEVEASKTVAADRSRLRQLFENLFRNAAEHGPAGIEVTVEDIDGGFAVEDDGPGLPEDVEETLFRPVDPGDGIEGLGLLIVERVVSGHDWEGTVADGAGARFEITRVEGLS